MSNETDLQWCRVLFSKMAEKGIWGVPRSGLVFQRRGESLILKEKMPFQDGMPGTPEELAEYQEADFQDIKTHFEAAGIEVGKEER